LLERLLDPGPLKETSVLTVVLLVILEVAATTLLCGLAVVDTVVLPKAVSAGATGAMVDWSLLLLGPDKYTYKEYI
jgi:hypothetical protein